MAKKKFVNAPPKYYAYYNNKTGEILSVTNEKSSDYDYGIEITSYEANKLISGEWPFSGYIVGRKKQPNGTTIKCIMPIVDQDYVFRNNVFEWIEESDKFSELVVEWNLSKKLWSFSIDPSVKAHYEKELLLSKLVFFITLENDFDFLIRTIFIDMQELLTSSKVSIPFTSNKETDITNISVSSKIVFKSYGLKILYE